MCYDPYAPQFYVSDCCIFRQDQNIVKEWLQWNSMLGMDHFYMYDHESTDNTNEVGNKFWEKNVSNVGGKFPNKFALKKMFLLEFQKKKCFHVGGKISNKFTLKKITSQNFEKEKIFPTNS